MIRKKRRKCQCCKDFFKPEPNNSWHQEYCEKLECRKASKKASQCRWLNKKENQNYFRCEDNVKRVQEWRKIHPGYSCTKRSRCKKNVTRSRTSATGLKTNMYRHLRGNALQDLAFSQPAVLIGIIAQLTGSTLQDDIENMACRLQNLGNDIIHFKGGQHDTKTSHIP